MKNCWYIFAGAVILLLHAIINGYPIVYSDTSTYLASGFELQTPFDRPITYGIFLWLTSINGLTLWTVVLLQSLLLSYLIFKTTLAVLGHKSGLFLIILLFLSGFSGISWVTSQLMADIFTSILVLVTIVILIGKNGLWNQVFLYFIFLLATGMHLGHFSYIIVLLIFLLGLRISGVFKDDYIHFSKLTIMFVLTGVSFLSMGSAYSKSKHAFIMGALVENGIIKAYLNDHCGEKGYAFCGFKDSLPEKAWQFLWDEESPFYKMGGWKGTKDEFDELIGNTLTEPKYLALHIKMSILATFRQLARFKMGDGAGEFVKGTLLYERIRKYVPNEHRAYLNSKQNTSGFGYLDTFNHFQFILTILSIPFFIFLVFKKRFLNEKLWFCMVFIPFAILINGWVSGTFANAIDRLGVKMIWMLPFIVILGVLFVIQKPNFKSIF